MSALTVYSSAPASTQLACACLSLHAVVRPLDELPAPAAKPRPPSLSVLADELLAVTIDLALLGDQLNEHEMGRCRLDAGVEQGLRFDREALQARKRALEAALQVQKGERHPMGSLPQLQRDLREVADALRLARERLRHYEACHEHALATEARRVVEGHEKLQQTLTAQLHAFT